MNGEEQASAVGNAIAALEERLGPQIEQVRETLSGFNEKALKVMRERPGTCLLCAVGFGFLIGRLASRR